MQERTFARGLEKRKGYGAAEKPKKEVCHRVAKQKARNM